MKAQQEYYFERTLYNTKLTTEARINQNIIQINSGYMPIIGDYITIWGKNNFYQGKIIAINNNDIVLDNDLNSNYDTESEVHVGIVNLAQNMPTFNEIRKYTLTNEYLEQNNENYWYIDKIHGYILCNTSTVQPDIFLLGNQMLMANTRGLQLRYEDNDSAYNIFNIKNNLDISYKCDMNNFMFGSPGLALLPFEFQLQYPLELKPELGAKLIIFINEYLDNQLIKEIVFLANVKNDIEYS